MQLVVSLLIRDSIGRYLMGKKRTTRLYCPPGGKVEEGEKLKPAGKRELLEETGILVRKSEMLFVGYAETNGKLIMFFATDVDGQVAVNTEPHKTEDWEWIDLDTIPDVCVVEGIRIYRRKYHARAGDGRVLLQGSSDYSSERTRDAAG
jgi:8-oxo-dGTP pyrophosphatase MutT (NUDIX family)